MPKSVGREQEVHFYCRMLQSLSLTLQERIVSLEAPVAAATAMPLELEPHPIAHRHDWFWHLHAAYRVRQFEAACAHWLGDLGRMDGGKEGRGAINYVRSGRKMQLVEMAQKWNSHL